MWYPDAAANLICSLCYFVNYGDGGSGFFSGFSDFSGFSASVPVFSSSFGYLGITYEALMLLLYT